jgi:hypothetical protein
VRGVVDFYASYVTPRPGGGGGVDILDACAQEICGGGPDGEERGEQDEGGAGRHGRKLAEEAAAASPGRVTEG